MQDLTFRQRFVHHIVASLAFFLAAFATYLKFKDLMAGNTKVLGTLIFYVIITVLFLIRRQPVAHSTRLGHWVAAMGASWAPFFLITNSVDIAWLIAVSVPIQLGGTVLMFVALLTLGRGFGVIAARRDVKTHGLYKFVRHPLYSAELISFTALLMQNPSWWNLAIYLLVLVCQIQRMNEEEAVLCGDPVYATYREQVRYRLFPGLY